MRLMKVLGQVEVCKFFYHLIFLHSQNQLGNWVCCLGVFNFESNGFWSILLRTEPAPICLRSCNHQWSQAFLAILHEINQLKGVYTSYLKDCNDLQEILLIL